MPKIVEVLKHQRAIKMKSLKIIGISLAIALSSFSVFANNDEASYQVKPRQIRKKKVVPIRNPGRKVVMHGRPVMADPINPTATNPPSNSNSLLVADFMGSKIHGRIIERDGQTLISQNSSSDADDFSFNTPGCNPNAVTADRDTVYVVCSAYSGNPDALRIYSFNQQTSKFNLINTITSDDFQELIAIAIDADKNIWVSSNGNSKILQITPDHLKTNGKITINKGLWNSPSSPRGIAFHAEDNSMWAVGTDVVINIDANTLKKLESNTKNNVFPKKFTNPDQSLYFKEPEGIAITPDGIVYVSNNGGNSPGKTLVRLEVVNDELKVTSTLDKFVCPGGVQMYPSTNGTLIFVNDESYGLTNTTCGAQDWTEQPVNGVVAVKEFNDTNLESNKEDSPVFVFNKITSRPGFGGLALFPR
jgi:hypothetical protein